MNRWSLLFVDRDDKWLGMTHTALEDRYDVHIARTLPEVAEPYPGGTFSLIFVTWIGTAAQRKEIARLGRAPQGRGRVVVVLPRHESSSEELRSIFLLGAYDLVSKPRTARCLRRVVDEELSYKYGASPKCAGAVRVKTPSSISA